MKTTIYVIIFLIAATAHITVAQSPVLYPDLTVISSDDRGMTVEFRPRFFEDRTIRTEKESFVLPQFMFGDRSMNDRPGQEDLRSRVIPVALPGVRGNAITVLSADYETVNNIALAPVAKVEMTDALGTERKTYAADFTPSQKFIPEQIASIEQPGSVKGWTVANIILTPLQFQSSSRTLRKYTRILFRIDYGEKERSTGVAGNDGWGKSALLNYSAGKQWNAASLRKSSAAGSVLAGGTWYKLEVNEEGMYKIDAQYLRTLGVEPSSLASIFDVKIFGADGRRITVDHTVARPADLPQMAVRYVDNNGNTKFDSDDYIMFFGQSTSGWNYDPVQKEYRHYTNPYTNSNYYFLSVGASAPVRMMQEQTVAAATSGTVTQALGMHLFKEEKFNFNYSGQNWVSAPFNPGDSRVISNRLHGWIPGTSVRYVYHLYSRANVTATFRIEESGVQIAAPMLAFMTDFQLNSPETVYAQEVLSAVSVVPSLTDQRSNVKFTYDASSAVASGFINWMRIFFRQRLTAQGNQFIFRSPDTTGVVEYEIDGFTDNDISVVDVSAMNSQKKLAHQLLQTAGSMTFKDSAAAGSVKKYWVGTVSSMKYPKSFSKIVNSDLHGNTGAEFIIITHKEFKSAAERLKQHKESLPDPISTVVVDVDSIFNEFGIGMPDPAAMRDFIKHAYENWTVRPGYVLFFGDATFDHKNILGNDRWWVPAIQTEESNQKIFTYNLEDFFAYLNPNNPLQVSIAHGRLCPRSAEEASFLVDRIIKYETGAERSSWKNLVTVVADDMVTPDTQLERDHIDQSESLVTTYTPKDFEVKRIYLEEYQTTFTSSGRRKPEARTALLEQINRGTLMLNYIGHGNPRVWAHESILSIDDVKTQFANPDKLTFIVAATCDWGRFEEGTEQSSAEEVMVNKSGGAIGVLSATRAVYSHSNAELNRRFYSFLFSTTPVMRLGDALLLTKNVLAHVENKQKYFLLGDPTMRLAVPSGRIVVDSINTTAASSADTMKALQKVTISATVRNADSTVNTNYNGTALVTVFDSEVIRTVPAVFNFSYRQPGAVIYKGEATIANGIMTATFIVPKDISYENKNGRISVYFSNTTTDGRGYTTNFIVGGTNAGAPADSVGPSISIYFDSPTFRSGDLVGDNPVLYVDLRDSSGINSSGSAIGHRIEAWLNGSAKSIDLTESYKGEIDSYQSGTVQYPMSGLSDGSHTLKVRAWDVYNNSSMEEIFFSVASGEGLSIRQLYNFPNPVSTTTAFTFQHNQLLPIDVTIFIYTVTGRMIHKIEQFGVGDRFVRIPWDRRDSDGDEVGNGIYFYKVTAKTIDGRFTSESIGTMAVVR
ncbi:MAG: type IX secretion system sortase PorU [Bacteroidota bacterium]